MILKLSRKEMERGDSLPKCTFMQHTNRRTLAYRYVPKVTQMPMIKKTIAKAKNKKPRLRANSGPTDDTLRQCGHRARALFSVLNCQKTKEIENHSLGGEEATWIERQYSPEMCRNNDHMWHGACPASMAPAVSLDLAPNLWFVCNSAEGTQFFATNFYIWANNCMDIERISCPAEHSELAENEMESI